MRQKHGDAKLMNFSPGTAAGTARLHDCVLAVGRSRDRAWMWGRGQEWQVCKACVRAEMTAMVAAGSLDPNHNTLPLSAARHCRGLTPFCCYVVIQVCSNKRLTFAARTGDTQLDCARGWSCKRVRSAAPGGASVPAPNCTVCASPVIRHSGRAWRAHASRRHAAHFRTSMSASCCTCQR